MWGCQSMTPSPLPVFILTGPGVPQAQEAGRGWVPGCLQLGLGSWGGG